MALLDDKLSDIDNREIDLVDSLKIGVFQIEPVIAARLMYLNHYGLELLGLESKEIKQGNLFVDNFDDRQNLQIEINRLIVSDTLSELVINGIALSKNGKVVTVWARKVNDCDGRLLRIDGFLLSDEICKLSIEDEILSEINKILLANLDIREIFDEVCNKFERIIKWNRVSISLVEEAGVGGLNFLVTNKNTVKSLVFKTLGLKKKYAYTGSLLEKVVNTKKPVIVDDTRKKENETDALFAKDGLLSRLAYPLKFKSKIIGSINFSIDKENYYKLHHTQILDKIVPFLSIAIENTKLYIRANKSEKECNELFKSIDSPWF